MPNKDPAKTEKKLPPAEQQAEDLRDWLKENDTDPERYTQHPDGSVSVKILYAYQVVDKGDPAGPKAVKFRPMYAGDFRELVPEHDKQGELFHAMTLRLSEIEEADLIRMHLADYDAVLAAAKGLLEKKFRPTS